MEPLPLGVDSICEIGSSIVAFAIAYYSLSWYRLTREDILLKLNLSFSLLGSGLLVHGVVKLAFFLRAVRGMRIAPPKMNPAIRWAYLICFISELAAYAILLLTYASRARITRPLAVLLFPPKEYEPVTEMILVFLTAMVTAYSASAYSIGRARNQFLVSLGFFLITLSRISVLLSQVSMAFFLASSLLQLVGFSCFLLMLVRVRMG